MSGKAIGIIVIVIIVIAGAWYLLSGPGSEQGGMAGMNMGTPSATPTADGVAVDYTNQGFSPTTTTIAEGDSVTWTNDSSENLWVASDPHPEHNGYDGTTESEHCAPGYMGATPFDACTMIKPGGSWTFIFTQVGSWGYHNHADDNKEGTVIVTAPAATSTSASVNVNL